MGRSAGVSLIIMLLALLCKQASPKLDLAKDKAKALMERIQNAGTEVVEAKVFSLLPTLYLPLSRGVPACLPASMNVQTGHHLAMLRGPSHL